MEATWGGNTPDGANVFFTTEEKLVSGDTDSAKDVYERTGSTTTHISIGPDGGNGSPNAFFEAASIDGSRVFFNTAESLVSSDTDAFRDIYQRSGGTTTHVSIGPDGGNGNQPALFGGISLDGTRVFFETRESLVAGDTDGACPTLQSRLCSSCLCFDVYERTGGTTTWLSSGGNGSHNASFAAISQEGGRVFFETTEALVAADTDPGASDVYERFGATTNLISQGPAGGNGPHLSEFVGASTDGTRVFFQTYEQLVASDTDATWLDVYERNAGATTLITTGPASPNGDAIPLWRGSSLDGTRAFFQTDEPLTTTDTDTELGTCTRERLRSPATRGRRARNPLRVALVPAYEACTSPNRTHGPPLAHPSCNPPTQRSSVLTIGTPDANGFTALSISSRAVQAPRQPEPAGGLRWSRPVIKINDVHCRVANAACPGGVGSDFVGQAARPDVGPDHRQAERPGGDGVGDRGGAADRDPGRLRRDHRQRGRALRRDHGRGHVLPRRGARLQAGDLGVGDVTRPRPGAERHRVRGGLPHHLRRWRRERLHAPGHLRSLIAFHGTATSAVCPLTSLNAL